MRSNFRTAFQPLLCFLELRVLSLNIFASQIEKGFYIEGFWIFFKDNKRNIKGCIFFMF